MDTPGPTHLEPLTASEGEAATGNQGRKPLSAALSAGHEGFVLGKSWWIFQQATVAGGYNPKTGK